MSAALTQDVLAMRAEVSRALTECSGAVYAELDGGLRRLVLTLGAIMVAAGATVVLLAWLFS